MSEHASVAAMNAVLRDSAPQELANAVASQSFLYGAIRKTTPSDPKGPRGRVRYEGMTAAAFVPGEDFAAAQSAKTAAWSLGWAAYQVSMDFDHLALLEATETDNLLINELEMQQSSAAEAMIDQFDRGIIAGDGSSEITGLTSKWISDDNTCAGIDRAVIDEFAVRVDDNSGTPRTITVALLEAGYSAFKNVVRKRALLGANWAFLCGPGTLTSVKALETGTSDTVLNRSAEPGQTMINGKALGISEIQMHGIPFVEVPGYTEGQIDLINFDALRLEIMTYGSDKTEGQAATVDNPIIMLSPFRIGSVYRWDFVAYLQLVLVNPRMNAYSLQDITYVELS